MKVLVTGGAGYIGSHTVVELVAAGFDVHLVDNFCNSERWILERVEALCGNPIPFTELDLLDEPSSPLKAAILRYFNPVGAHESGLIGELPCGVPNNLAPFAAQKTAGGLRTEISVFGDDYPDRDGTGVRNYIHMVDLARAHVAAPRTVSSGDGREITVNFDTSKWLSVLGVISAFERTVSRPIPKTQVTRRPGDMPQYRAGESLAERVISWGTTRGFNAMCADTRRWQQALAYSSNH